jgi:quercetin dioxygenase-like cupin family protein
MSDTVFAWSAASPRTVIPGFHGRFIHSGSMTFALWDIEEGAVLPVHSHVHEQVVHLLEGRFEVTVDGVTSVLEAGMVGVIPPNAVHSGRALTACRIMDAFAPVRDDYRGEGTPILQTAAGGA